MKKKAIEKQTMMINWHSRMFSNCTHALREEIALEKHLKLLEFEPCNDNKIRSFPYFLLNFKIGKKRLNRMKICCE